MDKDSLRRQLYDEIHSQFEARLTEARRQKAELEEQIELSEDKWRNERRRLNAEIDRLELVIADSRESRRKSPTAKGRSVEPQDVSKLQTQAADERLKKAEQMWAAERAKLKSEVSRLQNGIAEMIERSNNPLRSSQAEKEKLESKLEDALRAKRHAEDALLQAKNEWEQEKVKLIGDVVKNRRSAVPTKISSKDDGRIEQLERQLDDAIKSRDKQLREADATKEKLERELERVRQAQVSVKASAPATTEDGTRLKADLDEARAQLTLATRRAEDERAAFDKQKTNLERQIREAVSAKGALERELEKARQELLRQGNNQSADTVSSEVVEQLRRQYDDRMQDMIHQKTQLSDELRQATSLLEQERSKLSLNGTSAHKQPDSDVVDAEVERIQDMIAGIARLIDDPETELSTVIRKNVERAELDAYLRGILFSLGRGPGL
jgi:DNA repair exonuclease SbcCD ATPase subunit